MTFAGTFVRRNFEPLVLSVQVLVDLAVIWLACFVGWNLREALAGAPGPDFEVYREVFLLTSAVTLVCFGGMLPVVEKAADALARDEELEVEIVAPALLAPLPRNTLLAALMSRPRVVIVEESHHEFGVSAEIVASLAEAGFRGKLVRIGTPPVPLASARSLERTQLPDEKAIVARVLDLF